MVFIHTVLVNGFDEPLWCSKGIKRYVRMQGCSVPLYFSAASSEVSGVPTGLSASRCRSRA